MSNLVNPDIHKLELLIEQKGHKVIVVYALRAALRVVGYIGKMLLK